jgi:hypothetical protein
LTRQRPERNLKAKIASINELRGSEFRDWFEVKTLDELREL